MLFLDTGQSGGLTLCPSDVVTTSGESVLMRAAGKPTGSSLRWRRKRYGDSSYIVIFDSVKMDYTQVDERYFVDVGRSGEKNLVIRDVQWTDAGEFTFRDEFSRQTASVNLVIIGEFLQLDVNMMNSCHILTLSCRILRNCSLRLFTRKRKC